MMAFPAAPSRAEGPAPRHAEAVEEIDLFFSGIKWGGRGEIRSEFLLGASHSACNVM